MIIWLNGAFGAGKTQTAFELNRRIKNSFVYDPEHFGYFMRKNSPKALNKGDFQDIPLWRDCNYEMLKRISENYNGIIIVPMTIVNPAYYEEIIGRLRSGGVDVKHFVLYASKTVLLKRLKSRFEKKDCWAAKQIDRCIAGFANEIFENKIYTDELTIGQAAESIAKAADIPLQSTGKNVLSRWLVRKLVQIRHIR